MSHKYVLNSLKGQELQKHVMNSIIRNYNHWNLLSLSNDDNNDDNNEVQQHTSNGSPIINHTLPKVYHLSFLLNNQTSLLLFDN